MGPDDEESARLLDGSVEIYDTERGEWTELSEVELGDPAVQAEQVLMETTEWVPLDLDKALRPPSGIFRTGGGLIIDWGWRRLVIGRNPWLPMGHPPPTWRRGRDRRRADRARRGRDDGVHAAGGEGRGGGGAGEVFHAESVRDLIGDLRDALDGGTEAGR